MAATLLVPGGRGASDPPTLLPWHQVGSFSLGESRARIEYDFGPRQRISAGIDSGRGYRLHGGTVMVEYDSTDHVKSLTVTTPYYQSNDGFGVGYRIPLGPCVRVQGTCSYRWRGLTYRPTESWWEGEVIWKGARVGVTVQVQRGVVVSYDFFKHGLVGKFVSPTAAERASITSFIKTASAASCQQSTCRLTSIRLAASDRHWADVWIYDPHIGGAALVLHFRAGHWHIASGPGTSDVGCGVGIPPQVLGDLRIAC